MYYDFEAHYYEVNLTEYLKIASIAMVLIVLIFAFILLYYAYLSKGTLRNAYLLMFVGHLGISIIPIPLSLMNRLGIINRELFMSYYCVTGIIGFFIFLTVFINNTSDRTSFLFKIVSISFLIYILMFNFISNLILNDREKSYDLLHLSIQNSILYADERPDDLRYILKYKPDEGLSSQIYQFNSLNSELANPDYIQETKVAYLLHQIENKNLTKAQLLNLLEKQEKSENLFSEGMIRMAKSYLKTLSSDDVEVGKKLAYTGAIKDEIIDLEELTYNLLEFLRDNYSKNIVERFKIDSVSELSGPAILAAIAKKRGCIVSGGEIDTLRAASIVLDEFRGAKIGNISLEKP